MSDMVRTLLEQYAASSDAWTDLPQLLSELLTNRTQLDPATAMLLTRSLIPHSGEAIPDRETDSTAALDQDAQLVQTRRRLKRLQREIEVLRRRNDRLAGALGACYLCWGSDLMCPECNGNGKPGSLPLDKALFEVYIQPVLRRLQQTRKPVQINRNQEE